MSPRELNTDRASWIHNKAGVDYGPYDSESVRDMILAGDVQREDRLMDQFSGRQFSPEEVPLFNEALTKYEEQQRDAQIAHEAEESYANLKQRRLVPIFIVLIILLTVATSWDAIMAKLDPSSRHTALAAVTMPITPDPTVNITAFPSAENPTNADSVSSEKNEKKIRVRARAAATPRKKKRDRPAANTEEAAPPQVQEFDFADDDAEAGGEPDLPTPLGASELRQFMSEKLKPAIMRCVRVQREELVLPAYRVHLRLSPSGKLRLHAIGPTEAKVPKLRDCVDLQVKRNQFRAFTGAERKLELPIKVQ